jgi:hypothetical protein
MPTPAIANPFLTLASLALNRPFEAITVKDLEAVEQRAIEAIEKSGPFFPWFITCYPTKAILRSDQWELGEKLLRFLWRGDYIFGAKPGGYHHFKGGLYTVERTAIFLEGPRFEQVVIYFGLKDPAKVFVRPLREWCEIVLWPDGEYRLRFMRI